PPVGVGEHLGVLPAAQVVAQDDPVRRGPAQRVAGPVGERINVAEPVVAADDEERGRGCGHMGTTPERGSHSFTIGRPPHSGQALTRRQRLSRYTSAAKIARANTTATGLGRPARSTALAPGGGWATPGYDGSHGG